MNRQDTDPAVERVRLELIGRHFMVVVLALTGVWTGIAIILTGAPNFIEAWLSPWSRYGVGGVAFVAGLVTSYGTLATDHRLKGWWAQVLGLGALTLWYAGMGLAYVGLLISQGQQFVGPGEPLSASSTGRGYVPFVSLGLAIMTATPLSTTIRLRGRGVTGGPRA